MIKYIFQIDYPTGKREDYLAWVKSIAADLEGPDEVRRATSYDNVFGASPNRIVELEFENMSTAGRYMEHEEVRKILDQLFTVAGRVDVHVMRLRSGDYAKS